MQEVAAPRQTNSMLLTLEAPKSYYRARYYDQSVGRFVSEDPVRYRGANNFYSYVYNRPLDLRDPNGLLAWGGGVSVAGIGGVLNVGGGLKGSCYVVGDTAGNTGLLCCGGYGGGYVVGGAISGQAASVVCPTCRTICDMEGDSIQVQVFGGIGPGVGGGGGASVSMHQAAIFASGGPAWGGGGGIAILKMSCKLFVGGKGCKDKDCQVPRK